MSRFALAVLAAPLLASAFLAACSRSNNLLLGEVHGVMGQHRVTVTDCYRTGVPTPSAEQWAPCRDAVITISGAELTVNGAKYGPLQPADSITVDHGAVRINGQRAAVLAQK